MMLVLLIFLGGILMVVFYVIGTYNALVGLRNQVKNAWAQIDVQLKRRHDLIPNLVETAKGYMKHERDTLEAIVNARSQAMSSQTIGEKAKTEGMLNDAVSKFFVVVENYPECKANQNFLSLQEELTSTENKIAFARQAYNDQALFFNNKIEMFPSNIVAGILNFTKQEFFEIQEAEREAPKVQF
ncbi:MAG: LemA family protein [Candidatus Omnitrophota bacterium]|jgi:LemA protein